MAYSVLVASPARAALPARERNPLYVHYLTASDCLADAATLSDRLENDFPVDGDDVLADCTVMGPDDEDAVDLVDWDDHISSILTAPDAPSDLSVEADNGDGHAINFTWTDNSSNEASFELQYANNSGFTLNAETITVDADEAIYSAAIFMPATTYWFRIRAVNEFGESAWSATESVTTLSPPAAPSGFSGTADGQVFNLLWTDNSSNESAFEVQYDTVNTFNDDPTTVTAEADEVSTSIPDVPLGTYYLRLRAVNAAGSSAWTSTISLVSVDDG